MLSALLHGKGKRLAQADSTAESLKDAFRKFEDLLTATIFERLAYLDADLLWRVLRETFKDPTWPDTTVVTLKEIHFWPLWEAGKDKLEAAVEPDVVLNLLVGEQAETWTIIVECKLSGWQKEEQLAREWTAYREEYHDESADNVWLAALGGLPFGGVQTSRQTLSRPDFASTFVTARWEDLLIALRGLEGLSDASHRIVRDVIHSLEFHGYRHSLPLGEIRGFRMLHFDPARSRAALQRFSLRD